MGRVKLLTFLLIFSLWDVYWEGFGIRPFDMLGFFAIAILILANAAKRLWQPTTLASASIYILIGTWIFIYSSIGLIASLDNIKPIAGFLLGFILFTAFSLFRISAKTSLWCMTAVMVVHMTFFLLQLAYYYAAGDVLNYYSAIGLEPRVMSTIFRPAGLYLEPASYAVSMLMLLTLRTTLTRHLDTLSFVAILSILLSISLWGIVASLLFLLFALHPRALLWRAPILIASIFVGYLLTDFDTIGNIVENFILHRIQNLDEDNSATDRYGGLLSFLESDESFLAAIFGRGISNEYHLLGSSGLSYILNAAGVVGLLIFFGLFALLCRSGSRGNRFLSIGLMLTAAPLWNTLFWWLWFALILRFSTNSYVGKRRFDATSENLS